MRPADAPASLPLVALEQIRGKHVLVIEDQIQTGGTLKKVCGLGRILRLNLIWYAYYA